MITGEEFTCNLHGSMKKLGHRMREKERERKRREKDERNADGKSNSREAKNVTLNTRLIRQ